ncbi:AAA family ATPase, partial [Methylobacterium ajmalii]|uniref:AAA family ATPase n=1 Tax=Methylobacterium ajmalii TaxID=2738439 RepID=UPI001AEDD4C5
DLRPLAVLRDAAINPGGRFGGGATVSPYQPRMTKNQNFKSFADATLKVGGLTVVVGANASGKSNLRDAFRFLHGIGRGYTLPEIIGGKYGEGGYREWAPLRGTTSEIVRFGQRSLTIKAVVGTEGKGKFVYEITVSHQDVRGRFRVESESLQTEDSPWKQPVFQTLGPGDDDDDVTIRLRAADGARGHGKRVNLRRDRPILTQLETRRGVSIELRSMIEKVVATLGAIRFLDLSADAMRQPSFPGLDVLGESGENLSAVLQALCLDADRKNALVAWVSELTPLEVSDFEFEADATGRIILFLKDIEGGRISAFSASDGTLRFLAMAAALLSDQDRSLFFFEEIDNGLHPSRMRVLIDLIERRVADSTVQVVTTTHSPDLLTIIGETTFESTSVVYRPMGAGGSIIRRVSELPHIVELRKTQTLGRLHSSGWFEDALYFDDPAEAAE